jgi:protein-S-isoprenylcysteine O-methyltransferase Ste14
MGVKLLKKELLKSHIISILTIPINFIVIMPLIILAIEDNFSVINNTLLIIIALLLIALGTVLLIMTINLYLNIGEGTFAPWDPNTELIQVGLYSYSRNPMILSNLLTLVGLVILFESTYLLGYMGLFFITNHIYFIFIEEPGLQSRFGKDYESYKNEVSRWFRMKK